MSGERESGITFRIRVLMNFCIDEWSGRGCLGYGMEKTFAWYGSDCVGFEFYCVTFPFNAYFKKKIEESLTPIKGYSHLITESNQQR
ncbi:hypothetical protein QTG56_03755 [Rossellomorea sp. AcN35-11]|nr:hypothetical protein [Rossellomorea aquimaris]WJV30264.1 hypothetical protein QTG56_03755 [Rossellomorea sp. AcN35-11]